MQGRRRAVLGLAGIEGHVRIGYFDAVLIENLLQSAQEFPAYVPLRQRQYLETAANNDR